MKGFAPGFVLKPRHKVSRRRPIDQVVFDFQTLVKNSPPSVFKKMIPSGITKVQDFSPDRVTVWTKFVNFLDGIIKFGFTLVACTYLNIIRWVYTTRIKSYCLPSFSWFWLIGFLPKLTYIFCLSFKVLNQFRKFPLMNAQSDCRGRKWTALPNIVIRYRSFQMLILNLPLRHVGGGSPT